MKTIIELPDVLMDQANSAARLKGITLSALIESGLRVALHPKTDAAAPAAWPDLTFHPLADQAGSLIEPSQWRDTVTPHDGVRQAG